jgi:hypothetical protein
LSAAYCVIIHRIGLFEAFDADFANPRAPTTRSRPEEPKSTIRVLFSDTEEAKREKKFQVLEEKVDLLTTSSRLGPIGVSRDRLRTLDVGPEPMGNKEARAG